MAVPSTRVGWQILPPVEGIVVRSAVAQGRSRKDDSDSGRKPERVRKPVVDRRIQPPPGSRQSVAAARQTNARSNRTQLWIGAVAVALIAVVVVVGLVLNRQANASPVSDHPTSTNSTASVSGGIITVTGGAPALTLDLYEDGICPACQQFESQYGQQIMKAVDEGKLTVRYHFMNFLNKESASHDYSTRAAAAFECVASVPAGSAPKGLFLNFHTRMFSSGTQPAEGGSADLSNADLAKIAVQLGAPQTASACITSGAFLTQAQSTADAAKVSLTAATPTGQEIATPAVVKDGALLNLNSTDWLTKLLG
ncbi:thioredoxin domain-containing protein [Nakamurella sp. PAMC28650]|uniref:DsbA family protein n=1 Tax=Nakamurella sp. PAMC28650 TaxID=2762325 RepID=UPI00164D9144|nr:thioredoxin domain-containing protein [Nakamurella sp. PAMC28650]QNK80554.1 thioredoxin domain-containing protein [Nakamurella sp. PAMC28650]